MSDNAQRKNPAFLTMFIPGLVLGLVVGGLVGAFITPVVESSGGLSSIGKDVSTPLPRNTTPRDVVPEPPPLESGPAKDVQGGTTPPAPGSGT